MQMVYATLCDIRKLTF